MAENCSIIHKNQTDRLEKEVTTCNNILNTLRKCTVYHDILLASFKVRIEKYKKYKNRKYVNLI